MTGSVIGKVQAGVERFASGSRKVGAVGAAGAAGVGTAADCQQRASRDVLAPRSRYNRASGRLLGAEGHCDIGGHSSHEVACVAVRSSLHHPFE